MIGWYVKPPTMLETVPTRLEELFWQGDSCGSPNFYPTEDEARHEVFKALISLRETSVLEGRNQIPDAQLHFDIAEAGLNLLGVPPIEEERQGMYPLPGH